MEMNFYRAALLAVTIFFVGCGEASKPAQTTIPTMALEGKAMGTFWQVSMIGVDVKRARELQARIQAQLDVDDQLLSIYKNDSTLIRFNLLKSLSSWPVNDAMAGIVTSVLRISVKTDGAMDVTMGSLINLRGFGPDQ